jgi:hypothetical protein
MEEIRPLPRFLASHMRNSHRQQQRGLSVAVNRIRQSIDANPFNEAIIWP